MKENVQNNLPEMEAKVLKLVIELKNPYGLQLVEASNGQIKRGSAYTLLKRLENKGLISSSTKERNSKQLGIDLRCYQVTYEGIAVYDAWNKLDIALKEALANKDKE